MDGPDFPQKLSVEDFARKIKAKYPSVYDDIPDVELAERVVRKHPTYADSVDLPQGFKLSNATTGYPNLDQIYEQAGRMYNVPIDLMIEQGRQETINFKPNVVYGRRASPKGALGAGQFMLGTAPTYGVTDRKDPIQSIHGQAKYMRKLLDQFDGDEALALAGYNSGEGAVLKHGRKVPPYKETQNYVKTITEALRQHRSQPGTLGSLLPRPTPTNPQTGPTLPPITPDTRPAPEAPGTIEAQVTSAMAQNSPRAAVLLTEPGQEKLIDPALARVLKPVQTPNGLLLVNERKAKALGVTDYAANVPALIGKVEAVPDTSNGAALVTTDPQGRELASSIVTSPEAAQAQAETDRASFPQAAQHELMHAQDAVANRTLGGVVPDATATPSGALAAPSGMGKTPPAKQARPQGSSPQTAPTTFDRQVGMPTDDDSRIVGTTAVDPKWAPERKLRTAILSQLGQHGVTPQEADAFIADRKRRGVALLGDPSAATVSIPFYILNEIKGPDAAQYAMRSGQAEARPLVAGTNPDAGLVSGSGAETDAELLKEGYGRYVFDAAFAATPFGLLARTLPAEQRDQLGADVAGAGLGGGGDTARGIAGILDYVPVLGTSDAGKGISRYLKNIGERSDLFRHATEGPGGIASTLVRLGADAPSSLGRLYLLSRLPGGAVTGMSLEHASQAAGRDASSAEVLRQAEKGAILGLIFAAAPKLLGGLGRYGVEGATGSKGAGKAAEAALGTLGVVGGTQLTERAFGTPEDEALHSGLVNGLFHLGMMAPQLLVGARIRGTTQKGRTVDATVTREGEVKLLKGQTGRPDVEVFVDTEKTPEGVYVPKGDTSAVREKEAPTNAGNRGGRIATTPEPAQLEERNPFRVESPDPQAVQAAAVDTRTRKVADVLKNGQPLSVDDIAKATRYNKKNLDSAIDTLIRARVVEVLPDNRVRLIKDIAEAARERPLYERYAQPEAPQTNAPTTTPTVPSQPAPVAKAPVPPTAETAPPASETVRPEVTPEAQAEAAQSAGLATERVSPEQQRRDLGTFTKDGVTYTRQAPLADRPAGNPGKVKFAEDVAPDFRYKLIEADELQPVHVNGTPNLNHFLPEAQPKARTDKASVKAADRMAENINFNEVGENSLAYSGAPITNERGEVIQGNNRAAGIKLSYGRGTQYKDQLRTNAEQFGFTPEQVDALKKPVLVRELPVDDQKAIELGNYDAKDVESGGTHRIEAGKLAQRVPHAEKGAILADVFQGADEEASLNQLIRDNGPRIIQKLDPYLTDTQKQSLVGQGKTLTPAAVKDIEDAFRHFLFSGGGNNLPGLFDALPAATQRGLTASLPKIFTVPEAASLVPEIQNAIVAANQYAESGQPTFEDWSRQPDMFTGGIAPEEIFTATEMVLARKLLAAKKQGDVKEIFADYAKLTGGQEADLFNEARPGLSKADAVKELFGVQHAERAATPRAEKPAEIPAADDTGRSEPADAGTRDKTETDAPAPAEVTTTKAEPPPAPSKPPRPTLHGVPPQELTPVLQARVLYAKERGVPPSDIAERYNLTPAQVESVGDLPPVGSGGQMSHHLIRALTPSKSATPEETADKIAMVNDLAGEMGVTERVARDAAPADVKDVLDAARLAIAKEMGRGRGSEMTTGDWLKWLDVHGDKLTHDTTGVILDAFDARLAHDIEKVEPFTKDALLRKTLEDIDRRFGLNNVPSLRGIGEFRTKILQIGYSYGLKKTAIERAYERARDAFLNPLSGSPEGGGAQRPDQGSAAAGEGAAAEAGRPRAEELEETQFNLVPESPLVVAHNLSAAKLKFADKMGGLAMPSLAITQPKVGFDGFGDITLLADKSLIDPKAKVPVTDADMYSPRYPSQKVKVKHNALKKFWGDVTETYKKHFPDEQISSHYVMEADLEDSGVEGLARNKAFQVYYLEKNGIEIPKEREELYRTISQHRDEMDEYASEVVDQVGGEYKFFKGFTYSGNKRLGNYTLDIVVKHLKSQMKEGEGFNYGAGSLRSKAAKKYRSIEQIQRDRNRITTAKDMEAKKDEMNTRLIDLADQYREFYKHDRNAFGYTDQFVEAVSEGVQKRNLRRSMEEWGFEGIDDFKPITDYVDELANLPTEYFEAKPQRAVQLQEFKAAVIPNDASPATRSILKKHGILATQYDPKTPGARAKAVEDASALAEVQFQTAWHGSPHVFDKFDISKIGTGEGAQVYGHGLYFASKESVADYYKNNLAPSPTIKYKGDYTSIAQTKFDNRADRDAFREILQTMWRHPEWTPLRAIRETRANIIKTISYMMDMRDTDTFKSASKAELERNGIDFNYNIDIQENALDALRKFDADDFAIERSGAKYKVDLKPSEDEFLLWDKPLSEQSEKVQAALLKARKELGTSFHDGAGAYKDISQTLDQQLRGPWVAERDRLVKEKGAGHPDTLAHWDKNPTGDKAASEYLKSLGIRGIKYLDGTSRSKGEGSYNYVIFDDADVEIMDIQFAREQARQVFYSQLERTIERKMPARASAEQVKAILRDTKAEERDWLGIDEFLADHPKVSKDELLDFVRANNVEIKEVEKGGVDSEQAFAEAEQWWNDEGGAAEETPWDDLSSDEQIDAVQRYRDEVLQYTEENLDNGTKFSQYTLPGGENYRELLLTLPPRALPELPPVDTSKWRVVTTKPAGFMSDQRDIEIRDNYHRLSLRSGFRGTDEEAIADLVRHKQETLQKKESKAVNFKSSHFDEPNILAHVRFDTRDGGKTLHIAEIQSDWHQAGRKKGYKVDTPEIQLLREQHKAATDAYDKAHQRLLDKTLQLRRKGLLMRPEETERLKAKEDVYYKQAQKLKQQLNALGAADDSGVPDAPFKKSWHELAMKRMLRYAAENGYERVTWDTGETSAERYDLSKQVESIFWNTFGHPTNKSVAIKTPSEELIRIVIDKDDGIIKEGTDSQNVPSEWVGKRLDDVVGKDLAEKIISSDEGQLEGAGLKTDAPGMKGFYDKILPSFANKYVKKWGAKVESGGVPALKDATREPGDRQPKGKLRINVAQNYDGTYRAEINGEGYFALARNADGNSEFPTEAAARKVAKEFIASLQTQVPVHSVAITPAMRASVMNEGQPLFSRASPEQPVNTRIAMAKAEKQIKNLAGLPNLARTAKFGESKGLRTFDNPAAAALANEIVAKALSVPKGAIFTGLHAPKGAATKIAAVAHSYGPEITKAFEPDATHGDLTMAIGFGGEAAKFTQQEEMGHRLNARSGVRVPAFNDELAAKPAIARDLDALDKGYADMSLRQRLDEVVAKNWRDDAEAELGKTADQVRESWRDLLDIFEGSDVDLESYATGAESIGQRGKEFAEYARQRRSEGVRETDDGEPESGGTTQGGRAAEGLPSPRRAGTKEGAGARPIREADRDGGLQRVGILGRDRQATGEGRNLAQLSPQALTPAERKWIETRVPKTLREKIADEVQYSKIPDWVPSKKAVKDVAVDVLSIPRTALTMLDLSASGRQGMILIPGSPIIAARAFLKQLRAAIPIAGEKYFQNFKRDLGLHPFIKLADASDLHLSSLKSGDLTKREELYPSRLLGDEPYFKNKKLERAREFITTPARISERAYVTFLDWLRINKFAKMARQAHEYNVRKGVPDNANQYKGIAAFINYATGRGDLGRLNDAAPILNTVFFAPRYWASRLQVMNPVFYHNLPPGARKLAIGNMVAFAGTVAGILVMMKAAGVNVETDPSDPQFLKLTYGDGDWSMDLSGGLVTHLRYMARMALAAGYNDPKDKRKATEKMKTLTEGYLRGRLAPIPGAVVNAATGSNIIGEPTSTKEELQSLFTPIMMDNFRDAGNAEGLPGIVKMAPEFFGISVSRFKGVNELWAKIADEQVKYDAAKTPAERKEIARRIKAWRKLIERDEKRQAEKRSPAR